MKTLTAYQTKDNKLFTDLEDAEDHEYFIGFNETENTDLTAREQEAFNFLTKTDLQLKEIAEKMDVAVVTVKVYCASIYRKTETKDRVSLLIKTYCQ